MDTCTCTVQDNKHGYMYMYCIGSTCTCTIQDNKHGYMYMYEDTCTFR